MPFEDTKSLLVSSSLAGNLGFWWGYLEDLAWNLIGRKFRWWRLEASGSETGAKRSASLSALRGYQKSSSIFFHRGDIEIWLEPVSRVEILESAKTIVTNFFHRRRLKPVSNVRPLQMLFGDIKILSHFSSIVEKWKFKWSYHWGDWESAWTSLIGSNFGRWRLEVPGNETGTKRLTSLSAFRRYQKSSSSFLRCGDIGVRMRLLSGIWGDSASQNFGYKLFSSEKAEVGVKRSALPNVLQGY